ncbi:DUF1569 domain-containing protein [Stigmatella sp. ncwal1]|uniref:DUF1569 domain-containing protein n=1 Tax=Stigmatella ashevillensis TaxID=2995309 RepID=A0ABT5D5Z0_9BACT|nr:DUF1569 domain-containing protein [Stigmatella ashevillena]MDC0709076.1 DUF1569 domain-containing protein [Stigmatella ashevillena]
MNRRKLLYTAIATPVVLVLGVKTASMARHGALSELLAQLQSLPADKLRSTGRWSVSEIFQHCAQSIRFSRLGYPQAKSALFQNTAGAAALNVFSAAGKMQHPLDEAIPGAPALVSGLPNEVALAELVSELEKFMAWQGELAPHFAYGKLSKAQYDSAHCLHVKNHLSEVSGSREGHL